MADNKKMVEAITSMDTDFAQWYTDVVKKAELCDYASVKGCMVIKPAGYAIWENIQKELDRRFKETGVQNVYMPIFIPESLLEKEKDHVEGFAPEVAWVTHGGLEPLQERLCVRPTSETLFCDFYARDIHSYRDLPKVYNKIKEGNRERIQIFEGTVIKRQNGGARETFTVRKNSNGIGVEKTWPLHSPSVDNVEVVRKGKVRRAKLNYLRDRVGKAAKVKELVK